MNKIINKRERFFSISRVSSFKIENYYNITDQTTKHILLVEKINI